MPRRPDTPCAKCGKLLWRGSGCLPPGERTCRACRNAAAARSRVASCVTCGVQFEHKPGRPRRCCSNACVKVAQRRSIATAGIVARPVVACEQCGAEFSAALNRIGKSDKIARQRFCSRSCAARRPRSRKEPLYPSAKIYVRPCDQCGRLFAARRANAKRCSTQCRIDASGQRVKDLYGMSIGGGGASTRWRKLLVAYLVERDGDRCGICHLKVDLLVKSGTKGSDLGHSIDHVVPRVQGGSDDPANLRLAHWGCNRMRKARGGNEQLLLIG